MKPREDGRIHAHCAEGYHFSAFHYTVTENVDRTGRCDYGSEVAKCEK